MKKFMLFLMCMILVFIMTGCGKNNDTPIQTDETVVEIAENTNTSIEKVAGETTVSINNESIEKTAESIGDSDIDTNEQEKRPEETEISKNINTSEKEEIIKSETKQETVKTNETVIDNAENLKSEYNAPSTPIHTPTAIELKILNLMNQERAKEGLPALTYNSTIYDCGVIRANECLIKWSHTRPNGTQYWTVFEDCNKEITTCCGENLAKTFSTAEQIVDVLMKSDGHRKNILHKDFVSVCITVLVDENGYYYMSQLFMGR